MIETRAASDFRFHLFHCKLPDKKRTKILKHQNEQLLRKSVFFSKSLKSLVYTKKKNVTFCNRKQPTETQWQKFNRHIENL